jgi:hypothetical protein
VAALDSDLAQEVDYAPYAARQRRMLGFELHGDPFEPLRQRSVGSRTWLFGQALDVGQDLAQRTMRFGIAAVRCAQFGMQFGEALAQ